MTSLILRGLFMSDGPPTEDRAVSAYLEYLALACVFSAAETLPLRIWRFSLGMLIASLIFHIVGIKWPRIKSKTATLLDWDLWGKRIAVAVRVLFIMAVLTLVIGGYYVTRTLFGSDQKKPSESGKQSVQAPTTSLPSETSQRVDWHDKQNWRHLLHTGMTKTQVRQLFGDPERMAVISNSEFWDYGTGEIHFADGALYSWHEPSE